MYDPAAKYKSLVENVPCNLCGADDYDVIYPSRYEFAKPEKIAHTFRSSSDEMLLDQLVQCRKCGLQYLNPRLRFDLILNGYSAGTDERFVSQVAARERTFAKYLDFIERIKPDKGYILDVGTAGGSFLGVAKERGWQIAGCEPSHWLSEWGSNRYGIKIHTGTIFDMKLEDAFFDVITLWDVIEHTPDAKATLVECRRVLKPNGVLLINYPDIGSVVARLMGRKWVFLLSVHLYYFTLETIQKLLSLTGFQTVNHQRHWQSLELGYIFSRMEPIIPLASKIGTKITNTLHIQSAQIPYWMGQTMVLATRLDKKSEIIQ